MTGNIKDIQLSAASGEPLKAAPSALLEAGKGIVGDRYYSGLGTFSEKLAGLPDFEITLIEQEEIDSFNAKTGKSYAGPDFRRNIITTNIRLNDLVGKDFSVGNATLKGIRFCEPCAYLSGLLGPEIMEHMIGKCGLRAQIVNGAEVFIGDPLAIKN